LKQVISLVNIQRTGYDYVELYHGAQPSWFSEMIVNTLKELNLKVYSVHLPKDTLAMKKGLFDSMCSQLVSFLPEACIKVVVLHPPDYPVSKSQIWRKRVDSLLELAETVECALSLEIIPNSRNLVVECMQLFDKRAMGVTVDTEHMHILGCDIHDMIDSFGDAILNIHFRNSDGNLVRENGTRNFLSPGKGNVDLLDVVRTLKSIGYEKALTVELGPSNYVTEIVEAREYVYKCLQMS
jgi:sugar phosphate isomerase/epimerase